MRFGPPKVKPVPEALPVLYTFRRCPYAMRARLAIQVSQQFCQLREVVLRDKAPEFLAASPKGTVPVLVKSNGDVLEESLDLMDWALGERDPEGWLTPQIGTVEEMRQLILRNDTEFKTHLDRYKYPNRYEMADPVDARNAAMDFLNDLDRRLINHAYLFGDRIALADMAIAPFVRQFAQVDRTWFDSQPWKNLIRWLEAFLSSEPFIAIMNKYPKWHAGDPVVVFPTPCAG